MDSSLHACLTCPKNLDSVSPALYELLDENRRSLLQDDLCGTCTTDVDMSQFDS